MIDAGVFAEDENFELLEGLIIRKMTKHPRTGLRPAIFVTCSLHCDYRVFLFMLKIR